MTKADFAAFLYSIFLDPRHGFGKAEKPNPFLFTLQVQVVELKVTWITKSFCPGGTDSVSPPPSVISQENLSR